MPLLGFKTQGQLVTPTEPSLAHLCGGEVGPPDAAQRQVFRLLPCRWHADHVLLLWDGGSAGAGPGFMGFRLPLGGEKQKIEMKTSEYLRYSRR